MTGQDLLTALRARGARASAAGDRLVIKAPPGTITTELHAALVGRKPEILALLRSEDRHAAAPPGPAAMPPSWRERITRLDHASWVRWRRRSTEIQSALGRPPTDAEIRAADRQAAVEVLAERDAPGAAPGPEAPDPVSSEPKADVVRTAGPSGWKCHNRFCLHKGRWWRSIHGVVNCSNCVPPAFPELVAETGIYTDQ